MIARSNGILPLKPTADHTGKEGYAVKASSGDAALVSGVSDIPLGVITEGGPTTGKNSIALFDGGLAGTVKVKLAASAGTVALGTYLVLHSDGSFKEDPGTGARVRCARALQSGANDELIEAVLLTPSLSEAYTILSTDNEIGALPIGATYSQAEITALRDKAEEVSDDVRGIKAKLDAQKFTA